MVKESPLKSSLVYAEKAAPIGTAFPSLPLVVEACSYNNQQNEQYDDQYESGAVIAAASVAVAAATPTVAHSSSPHFLLLNSNICKA